LASAKLQRQIKLPVVVDAVAEVAVVVAVAEVDVVVVAAADLAEGPAVDLAVDRAVAALVAAVSRDAII